MHLTESGVSKVERMLGIQNLYDPSHIDILHHVNQALRAHTIYKRDVHYIVKDGQVIIVDEFTGRLMPGRRWSDGLHQAVEAKEGVRIERENQTLATITIQNYFRMYRKLAGMTGTADTEAAEFKKIYKLDVMVIPPNKERSASTIPTSSTRPSARSSTPSSSRSPSATSAGSRCWSAPSRWRSRSSSRKLLKTPRREAQRAQRGEPRGRGQHHRPGRAPAAR